MQLKPMNPENLTELASLLEWYRQSIPVGHSQENYLVQLASTQKLVETRLAEVLRSVRNDEIQQTASYLNYLKKSKETKTDRRTSIVSEDPSTDYESEFTHPSMTSHSPEELFIAQ